MTGFDDPRGHQSEELAFQAERAARAGRLDEAAGLFAEAAALEAKIARAVPHSDTRVRGVLAVSAVALWYKARRYDDAQQLACEFLSEPHNIDDPSRRELRALLERCWRDQETAQVCGAGGQFEPLEIKLAGGEIQAGVAPAASVRDRQSLSSALLIRTAEWLSEKPFRVRGEASRDISRRFRVLEAPARAASYGLRLYVAVSGQPQLPVIAELTPRAVVDTFLQIARAAQASDQVLADLIPDAQYRAAFLAGFRDLAPDGALVGTVTFEHPTWDAAIPKTIYEPRHREEMTRRLAPVTTGGRVRSVEGMLKVVNLKARAPSIEIVAGQGPATHISIDVDRFEESVREKLNKYVKVVFEERARARGKIELYALDIALRDEQDEFPWESAARQAVEAFLEMAEWDEVEKVVSLPFKNAQGEPLPLELESLEDLLAELADVASKGWLGFVPWDAGKPVFPAETDQIVRTALAAYTAKLAALGWDINY